MTQCSMIGRLFRRCSSPGDVQARVEQLLEGIDCDFVLVSCNSGECLRRYSATVREFKRTGARVTEIKLPYAAVVALKQVSEQKL